MTVDQLEKIRAELEARLDVEPTCLECGAAVGDGCIVCTECANLFESINTDSCDLSQDN